MKKAAFISMLLIVPILLSGCIIISSNKTQPKESSKTNQTNATIAEIDAARGLNSDSAKLEIYEVIAKRTNLSSQERIHLIEESEKQLHSDSAKKKVLLVLVNNQPNPVLLEQEIENNETMSEERN
ncbi:MAG: hypothetical protein ACYTER_05600 [Planctomycetota bacterium]|jgi:uncharacterized protein YceK